MKSRMGDVEFGEEGGLYTILLHDRRGLSADIVVGAERINSAMREWSVVGPDKPTNANGGFGDEVVAQDEGDDHGSQIEGVRDHPQSDYLVGPDVHAVIFPFHFLNNRC